MRIAIISDHASPLAAPGGIDTGGQNVYVAQIARHLARQGHEVDVFTRRDDERLPKVVRVANRLRVINVLAGPAQFVRKEELLPFMEGFAERTIAFAYSRLHGYDIVHANFFMSGLVACRIRREMGLPFVITFHALGRVRRLHQKEADGFPDERFEIEDRIVREADRIIAECPQDMDDLIHLYNARAERISIVPCGFDPEELWPVEKGIARAEVGLPAKSFIMLQLGRIVPRKGIDTVIEAFGRLVRTQGPDPILVVVGGSSATPDPSKDAEIGRLMSIARREGVEDKVLFMGRRDRDSLRFYYSAADIFVTTPWYEPFGITPVEAMACATPVVGSDVGGIRYSVADGLTGCLVPPRSPGALADCLARLMRERGALEAMGRRGVERANRLFTWERVADELAGIYADVIRPSLMREGSLSIKEQTL